MDPLVLNWILASKMHLKSIKEVPNCTFKCELTGMEYTYTISGSHRYLFSFRFEQDGGRIYTFTADAFCLFL